MAEGLAYLFIYERYLLKYLVNLFSPCILVSISIAFAIMPKRVSNDKFFTLQRMLTMSDIEAIAAIHGCSISYVTKVVSMGSTKFDLDILKTASERARANLKVYSRRIDSLFKDIERIENYTDEQMKRDIDWFERNFKDID